MAEAAIGPWVVLALLGAAHGLNPGMGWLFAVALGVQNGERRAVWGALVPLALGHALAVAAAVAAVTVLGFIVPVEQLRWLVAATLLAAGIGHWRGHHRLRFGGMRVGLRDLTVWSFLMATAHGAGIMALPFALDAGAVREPDTAHAAHATPGGHAAHTELPAAAGDLGPELVALLAAVVHAAAYLIVTGLVAVLVYERLGLRLLRRAWINVDRIWAAALVATGIVVVLA